MAKLLAHASTVSSRTSFAPHLLGFAAFWTWTLVCFRSTLGFVPPFGAADIYLAQNSFFGISLVTSVVCHPIGGFVTYRWPALARTLRWPAAICMCLSVAAASMVGGAQEDFAAILLAVAGLVSGATSAFLDVSWAQVYGRLDPGRSGRYITGSLALAFASYYALILLSKLHPVIPLLVTLALPLLSAGALTCDDRRSDVAGNSASHALPDVHPMHNAVQIARVLWQPVLGSLIFFVAYGCLNSIALAKLDVNELGTASVLLDLVAALAFLALLTLRRRVSTDLAYSLAMVLVTTGFVLLPFAIGIDGASSDGQLALSSSLVSAGMGLFDLLLLCMIAQCAYDYRTSGGFISGIVRGVTIGASAVGGAIGTRVVGVLSGGEASLLFVLVGALYLFVISMSLYLGRRGARRMSSDGGADRLVGEATEIGGKDEERPGTARSHENAGLTGADPDAGAGRAGGVGSVAGGAGQEAHGSGTGAPGLGSSAGSGAGSSANAGMGTGTAGSPSPAAARLTLDERIAELANEFHLSRREVDVLALLARGRSIPFIAEALVISENTVRSHAQRIYVKLDVHSKQELLNLVQEGVE